MAALHLLAETVLLRGRFGLEIGMVEAQVVVQFRLGGEQERAGRALESHASDPALDGLRKDREERVEDEGADGHRES